MNILRASVTSTKDWWELRLLDLNVVADGPTESDMLRDLTRTLTIEFHLARREGRTPFVDLRAKCAHVEVNKWNVDHKKNRDLGLSEDVKMALAAVLGRPTLNNFQVEQVETAAA